MKAIIPAVVILLTTNCSIAYSCEYSSEAAKQAKKFRILMSGIGYGLDSCIKATYRFDYEMGKHKTLRFADEIQAVAGCQNVADNLRSLVRQAQPLEEDCEKWREEVAKVYKESAEGMFNAFK